jgi:hypothetical protein
MFYMRHLHLPKPTAESEQYGASVAVNATGFVWSLVLLPAGTRRFMLAAGRRDNTGANSVVDLSKVRTCPSAGPISLPTLKLWPFTPLHHPARPPNRPRESSLPTPQTPSTLPPYRPPHLSAPSSSSSHSSDLFRVSKVLCSPVPGPDPFPGPFPGQIFCES